MLITTTKHMQTICKFIFRCIRFSDHRLSWSITAFSREWPFTRTVIPCSLQSIAIQQSTMLNMRGFHANLTGGPPSSQSTHRTKQNNYYIRIKAAKYEIQKPSTCHATLFRCKFLSMFPVFHVVWSTWPTTKTFVVGWRKLLWKVERTSTLSNKFWLFCSFFIKLTTCHATYLLVH